MNRPLSRRELSNSLWVGPHLFSLPAEAATLADMVAPYLHSRQDERAFVLAGGLETGPGRGARRPFP